jgi:hypothetical protein
LLIFPVPAEADDAAPCPGVLVELALVLPDEAVPLGFRLDEEAVCMALPLPAVGEDVSSKPLLPAFTSLLELSLDWLPEGVELVCVDVSFGGRPFAFEPLCVEALASEVFFRLARFMCDR